MFLFFLWISAQDEPAATDRICCATRPGIERLNPVISRRRMTADRQHGLFIAAVGRNFAKDHRQYCGSAPNPNAQCCKADDRHQTCGHPGRLPLSYLQLKRFPGDGENSFCQSAWDSASASLGHRQCGAESHIYLERRGWAEFPSRLRVSIGRKVLMRNADGLGVMASKLCARSTCTNRS